MLGKINKELWLNIENRLTPPPPDSKKSKAWGYFSGAALIPIGLTTLAMDKITSFTSNCFCCCSKKDDRNPNEDFSVILEDSRKWEEIRDIESRIKLGNNPKFLKGTATCTYQDSGAKNCPRSQWADWEKEIMPEGNRSGFSANLFELYKTQEGRADVIKKLQLLNVNSYRFSIEWSHIEPKKGKFDKKKLKIYVNFCKALRDAGIAPMITLHHFSEPKWFHDKGSFEKEENIEDFLAFAEYVFPDLTQKYHGKPLVEHVCTINEPAGDAFSKYIRGAHPPGGKLQFKKAGLFLKGALKAHCLAYKKLKKINPKVQIGIVHSYSPVEAKNDLVYPIARYLTRLINDTALNFFKTNKFDYKIPLSCNIQDNFDDIEFKTDFVGLQYYARTLIGLTGSTSYHEPMTEMPYREDPEGLYEAIKKTFEATGVPIIITENGISTKDPEQRARYFRRAFYAIQRAQEEIGEKNLQGYHLWTPFDNYEWSFGWTQKFGAFELFRGAIAENPKKGMQPFIDLFSSGESKDKPSKKEVALTGNVGKEEK